MAARTTVAHRTEPGAIVPVGVESVVAGSAAAAVHRHSWAFQSCSHYCPCSVAPASAPVAIVAEAYFAATEECHYYYY